MTVIGERAAGTYDTAVRTLLPGVAMVAVSFGLARYGYGLLLPQMRGDLHLSAGAAGIISSASYVSYLLANVGVVAVINRRGPRTAVVLAAVAATAGMTLVAVAGGVAVLSVGLLVGGAAAGFVNPAYADMMASRVRPERRDAVWAAISSGTGWGVAIAGPIAVAAGDRWRLAWIVFVIVAVVAAVPAVLLAAPRPITRSRPPQLSLSWFFCPKSRPLLVSAVLLGFGSSVWWAFSVDALHSEGVSAAVAKIVYAVCGVASIAASCSGMVFNRTGLRAGYLAACALLASSLGILGVTTGSVSGALCAAILFGAFYNAVIAAGGIWSTRIFSDHPSAGMAAYLSALTIGNLIGPSVAGLTINALGYPTTLLASAGVVALALPFCPPTARRRAALAEHICQAAPVKE